jgi:hypothetical protein
MNPLNITSLELSTYYVSNVSPILKHRKKERKKKRKKERKKEIKKEHFFFITV